MVLDPPGFFGKTPARGDFITRRLAPALAEPWDRWLGELTIEVRDAAGPDWPEAWLTAPLWRFALGPGPARGPGAAGVLIASVDRVGRMFPFTVIGPALGIPDQAWYDAAEILALESLDEVFDPDLLDSALVRLGPPGAGAAIGADQSVWWSRGSDRVAPGSRTVAGLPDRQTARAMVMGDQNAPHSGAK